MKILMLSWRDKKNPKKGGAEVVTDKYLSGLASKGHEVTLLTSSFSNAKKKEQYNGYKIIRKGGTLGVYFYGWLYALKHKNEFDVIIDQINTIPFFTFLGIPKNKRICFIHQLCQNVWFWESGFPINWIGYLFENIYLKFYRNTRVITVSNSTKEDLVNKGFTKVSVIENAIDFKPAGSVATKKSNQLCFVGRLKNSKRVHDCIKAVSLVKDKLPDLTLKIVGVGDKRYENKLKKMVKELNLEKNIEFLGSVNLEERNKIMAESEAILVTSVREGWGLIVTEANANGTLAITYDVHGLRDANKTGVICGNNTPENLSEKIVELLNDKSMIISKSEKALRFSYDYVDWQNNLNEIDVLIRAI